MSSTTRFEWNPILNEAREGFDFKSCWTCRHGVGMKPNKYQCLKADAVWCEKYSEMIDSPHDQLADDEAECWKD